MTIAKPTKQQLMWHDLELGVLINNISGDFFNEARLDLDPEKAGPKQWVRAAKAMGAKYVVIQANQTGTSTWPTKADEYSISAMKYKNGKGDLLREFVDACREEGILPGFYYHPTCNVYYNIDPGKTYDFKSEDYQKYARIVEKHIEELLTEYGDILELWFDGGCVPVEDGGPDIEGLIKKYQPGVMCFQGPKRHPNNVRWVGNEKGLAPENCWATTYAGDARFDGTIPNEEAGVGDPDGIYYWPAECDMPNRTPEATACGWNWAPGETDKVFSTDHLIDCYIRSVGRNANFLLGMTISDKGIFEDEEQYRAFGEKIKELFGNPIAIAESVESAEIELDIPADRTAKYLVVREDITEGQRVRAFSILADGKEIYSSNCIGHKRIVPLGDIKAEKITFRVTESACGFALRDVAVY